ncbi:hypothetical protein WJX73_008464 [Symbiochloris irregularis]|uniref:Uncharacterized protein n=1 Tax=Symbiochloris irregularis TaxID=706552 RepID=A0AAW1NT18_9CHLO
MHEGEVPAQPLKPEAAWPQHAASVPLDTNSGDPAAHAASSAFAPPSQLPAYADGNTLALLHQWYAMYAQQQRAMGAPEGAANYGHALPPGVDPAIADPSLWADAQDSAYG